MSIFSSIVNAIFKAPAKVAEARRPPSAAAPPPAAPASAPTSQVDVAAVLAGLAAQTRRSSTGESRSST